MKLKIVFVLCSTIFILFIYANLKYESGYNIIIENKTGQCIDRISLIPRQRIDRDGQLDITQIAPNETIKISRKFYRPGESFIAEIDTPSEKNKEIPLAYIYSPEAINIVYIIIEDVTENKISKMTVKSFDNSPGLLGWLRSYYDYNITEYSDM